MGGGALPFPGLGLLFPQPLTRSFLLLCLCDTCHLGLRVWIHSRMKAKSSFNSLNVRTVLPSQSASPASGSFWVPCLCLLFAWITRVCFCVNLVLLSHTLDTGWCAVNPKSPLLPWRGLGSVSAAVRSLPGGLTLLILEPLRRSQGPLRTHHPVPPSHPQPGCRPGPTGPVLSGDPAQLPLLQSCPCPLLCCPGPVTACLAL